MRPETDAPNATPPPGTWITFAKPDLQHLITALRDDGYTLIGPTVEDGAIIYDEIDSIERLPRGLTDEQAPGVYRLKPRDDDAYFGYNVGPYAWKKFLHPPELRLWEARRENGHIQIRTDEGAPRYAFLGVRACELAAITIQDKVFLGGPYVDPYYLARRERTFIIAVNCTQAGGTCFCASMGTGPEAREHYDIVLTELDDVFIAQAGSERGAQVLGRVPHQRAEVSLLNEAQERIARTVQQMGRSLDTTGIRDLLFNNLDHPRWDDVASRCLTCANCTLVCPTCFCFTVEDVTDLSGEHAARVRRWDSCFTMEFTYTAGHIIRQSAKARYRQWLVHKFAGWIDQFGTSGCVGCGRCITWCPAKIDITEEVAAIRETA